MFWSGIFEQKKKSFFALVPLFVVFCDKRRATESFRSGPEIRVCSRTVRGATTAGVNVRSVPIAPPPPIPSHPIPRSTTFEIVSEKLTVTGHAQPEAFLEPAILAPVPVDAVHHAVLVARTLVVDDGRLRPPEEPLAALARDHAVVDAARLVAAHLARYDLDLSCNTHGKSVRQ